MVPALMRDYGAEEVEGKKARYLGQLEVDPVVAVDTVEHRGKVKVSPVAAEDTVQCSEKLEVDQVVVVETGQSLQMIEVRYFRLIAMGVEKIDIDYEGVLAGLLKPDLQGPTFLEQVEEGNT